MLRHEVIQGEKVWKPILGSFIFLGLLLRTVRYLACYPLWSDEAFVAANFIRRDYLELLKPLDYGQICPILFLWPVRAIVGLFGFSEGSLRLFPLLCGFLSLGLFVKLSSKLLSGLPLVFAVSIFAVSAGPIRYSSEVKPYASDLLAALLLLNPALGWLQDRSRTASLWWLAALTPLALTLSHPAIFVAAGISLGIALSIWMAHERSVLIPFVIFNAAIVVLFPTLYFLVMLPQNSVLPAWREGYWENGFPPVQQPLLLIRWLLEAHTSKMLAYPGGGPRGASILTSLLLLTGSISLWRSGKRPALIVLLAAFGFTLIAATLRKYPYGNESRHMQYVAPAICLLAGLGLDVIIRALFKPSYQRRISALVLAVMFVGGLSYFGKFATRPFINSYDVKARDFARGFWPKESRGAEVACLMHDFGIYEREYFNFYTAAYLCNQMIYSPQRREGRVTGPDWSSITAMHPLRCVLYKGTPIDHPEVRGWLAAMKVRYDLRTVETLTLTMSEPKSAPITEPIVVFEFVPNPREGIAERAPEGTVRR